MVHLYTANADSQLQDPVGLFQNVAVRYKIYSTAKGVSSFWWGLRDVDAVSPHSGAFYHVCGVKMVSQPTWSAIADYYYGLVNWENPV